MRVYCTFHNPLVSLSCAILSTHTVPTKYHLQMSIRDNILLGNEFDREKYKVAIASASMWQDLEIFPEGDATVIGERGITLSGGQKTRVSIARSVYADADIIIMDDPFAAVDAHVGNDILNRCVWHSVVMCQ